jgi:hypothetical protein
MSAFDKIMFINAIGVDSSMFGNEMHFISFVAILSSRNGTEGTISISETLSMPVLKCLATGWLAPLPMAARRCSPKFVLKDLPISPI